MIAEKMERNMTFRRMSLSVVVLACASFLPSARADQDDTCPPGEMPWQRTADETLCVVPCRSDDACVGGASGEERCRLIGADVGTEDVFIDEATALELDAQDEEAVEEAAEHASVADLSTGADATMTAVADEGFITVNPECEGECAPMRVPAPRPATTVRICDPLWDVVVAADAAPDDSDDFDTYD